MKFASLAGNRVAVWGSGTEGAAVLDSLAFDNEVTLVVDDPTARSAIELAAVHGIRIARVDELATMTVDVVVKSPGVPLRRPEIVDLKARGVRITSLLDLWLEAPRADLVVGVTGTKGKSTTAMLIADLVRASGRDVELAGNIGRPVSQIDGCNVAVIEVSSYQAADLTHSPHVGVLTNLGEDHLPWHGSVEAYQSDKLRLFAHRELAHLVVGPGLRSRFLERADLVVLQPDRDGYHADGGALWNGSSMIADLHGTALEPDHLASNLALAATCAAVVVAEGLAAEAVASTVRDFERPPGRLEPVPSSDGVEWVNDSLASNPFAAAAGIVTYRRRPLIAIVGGGDRGVDATLLVDALVRHGNIRAIVCIGEAGVRWHTRFEEVGLTVHVIELDDIAAAVRVAAAVARSGDVVLFSPGAPTAPSVGTWETRSRAFRSAVAADR